MNIGSTSVLTAPPAVGKSKSQPLPLPIRVSDGSRYEPILADQDEVEPASVLPAAKPGQFAELDFEIVNGARVSLYRDPEQPLRYHVAVNGRYHEGESTDDLGQAQRNFKGVQFEVWDARKENC